MTREAEHDSHRTLRLFLGYRLFLALLMALVFFIIQRGPLGSHDHDLFAVGLAGYLAITLMSLLLGLTRQMPSGPQAILAVVIDILCISILVYASGGVQSGLGDPVRPPLERPLRGQRAPRDHGGRPGHERHPGSGRGRRPVPDPDLARR